MRAHMVLPSPTRGHPAAYNVKHDNLFDWSGHTLPDIWLIDKIGTAGKYTAASTDDKSGGILNPVATGAVFCNDCPAGKLEISTVMNIKMRIFLK